MAGVTAGVSGHVAAHNNRGIDVTLPPYNAVGDGVTDDTAAIQAAIDAADAAGTAHSINHASNAPGETLTVYCPPGIYLTTGLSFDGKNVLLRGDGPAATRFRADPGITGYVMDLRGWKGFLAHHRGSGLFGGFSIEGSHTADATLATGGLIMGQSPGGGNHPGGYLLENISIFGTGGPAFKMMPGCHLGDIRNLTLQRPVGADINDVPYLHVFGDSNGVRWHNLGLRSVTSDPDGTKVAFWEYDSPSGGPWDMPAHHRILHPWTEQTNTPSGGAVFWLESSRSLLESPMVFDQAAEASPASPHSFVRLAPNFNSNTANEVRGPIPADNGGGSFSYGVYVDSNGNRVTGPRGYRNNNVYLAPGAGWNYVEFGGAESPTNIGATPFVDDSGVTTNTLIDHNTRTRIPAPDVSGSTGANAALQDLLAELEGLGLIVDSST